MISLKNDYSEGSCPQIIAALQDINGRQYDGYGMDVCCEEAKSLIRKRLKRDCDIHFLVGGTLTNITVIASILRPFEAVIAVDSGHINVHETGAIEASGHKVIITEGAQGKITCEGIRKAVSLHEDEHMVKPAMVYISNASELGSIYHKDELIGIHEVCKELGLYLYMDGARLGSALCAEDNDITLEDIAALCDVFYIGGTKNGALFGEAVVIVDQALRHHFRYMMKQRGGLLAKGWLLGIQFKTLFEHDLFFELAQHANKLAQQLQLAMQKLEIPMLITTTTNQIFPILNNEQIQVLRKHFAFQTWEIIDKDTTAVRFVTSWATKEEDVLACIKEITAFMKSR